MTTREFAEQNIRFSKTSPVTGEFDLAKYPFLGKPMDAADDIRVKRLVILKASSCLGTVLGQIINSRRIACDVGDQIMVCQTDDDATKWTKTRGKEWLESIPDVVRLLKNDKYAQTNELWLFRHKFLIITGPGIAAAQSDQVRYVQTDESHLPQYPPGRLVEFEKRMGSRWDRQSTHITTAADQGKEIDQFYYAGSQNEWHARCPKCNRLFWMLWEEDARQRYNGERVFLWDDSLPDAAILESIQVKCPHCDHVRRDNDRDRYALQRDGDYEAQNLNAPISEQSYRWSVFAAHWIPWRDMLAEYKAACNAWTLGDLKPYEDWNKKRLCKTWVPMPPVMSSNSTTDYRIGDVWVVEEDKLRDSSFDIQDSPFHIWGQADEFTKNGDSRRLAYEKFETWAQAAEFQRYHNVHNRDTYVDAGHRMDEVFRECCERAWTALFADDRDALLLEQPDPRGPSFPLISTRSPFSKAQPEDTMIGRKGERKHHTGNVPAGFCLSRRWSKPWIGGLLMSLKSGQAGRYYGIAADINPAFVPQLNSYAYATRQNKTTGVSETFLKQISKDDHAFATSCMALTGAVIRGFMPLSTL